jgi:cell division protein FtsZ
MVELGISGIEFIGANTDQQALQACITPVKVQLGPKVTRGLGSGGNPQVGEAAAEESIREIASALEGADMVFLTAGMGGGTGTGSIAVAAKVARAIGAVTVGIVTTPFSFEMGKRQKNANDGLSRLREHTDTLITVPNDKLLFVAPRDLPMETAFRLADDVLRQGIQGIAEMITTPGLINVDFAHVRRIMKMGGGSLLSMGQGDGFEKARKAVDQALHHPLLESVSLHSAGGIIANFSGGHDLSFMEVTDALNYLQEMTGNQAEIIPGFITDEMMEDRAQVILVVTGLGGTPVDLQFKQMQEVPLVQPSNQPQITEAFMRIDLDNMKVDYINDPRMTPAPGLNSGPVNLDLPAFLRRRGSSSQQAY